MSWRAQGFAAALGTGELEAVHFLLAVLWDDQKWSFAENRGVPRERVLAALARQGVALPVAPLPPLDHLAFTQRVDLPYDELDAVIDLLLERHPRRSGPRFAFNHDGAGNAWVVAGEGIDLPGVVDDARAGPDRGVPS